MQTCLLWIRDHAEVFEPALACSGPIRGAGNVASQSHTMHPVLVDVEFAGNFFGNHRLIEDQSIFGGDRFVFEGMEHKCWWRVFAYVAFAGELKQLLPRHVFAEKVDFAASVRE